jgi:hypothetical protein
MSMRDGAHWQPKVDSCQTTALIDEGTSAASIAVSLKRSITVIRAKARSLDKPFPMVTPR